MPENENNSPKFLDGKESLDALFIAKDKFITSKFQTNEVTDYQIIEAKDGVLEYRPIYPNVLQLQLTTANLKNNQSGMSKFLGQKGEGEEEVMRYMVESAIRDMRMAERIYEEKTIKEVKTVKIKSEEPITQILILAGQTQEGNILVEEEKDGQKVIVEKTVPAMPYFQILEAPEGQVFDNLFEQKTIEQKARIYLNLVPTVKRKVEMVLARCDFTKSRDFTSGKFMNEQIVHQYSNVRPEASPNEQQESTGLFAKGGK
jgi:hypothetical protein